MKTRILFVLLLVFFALPALVRSADFVGLGPRLGYYKSEDAEEGELFFGGGLRLKLGRRFGLEAAVDYRAEEYHQGRITIKNYPVQASVLVYPIRIAYGVAGMGWYNTKIDYNESLFSIRIPKDKMSQDVGWHFGGGVELPLGGMAALAADVRYVFIDYDFSDYPGSEDIESDFVAFTLTLMWGL